MSTLMLVNRKRKSRASTKKRRSSTRRTRVTRLRSNPRRRRHAAKRRVHYVTRMRRNPRRSRRSSSARAMSVKGFLNHTLMPATVGAGGGLLLNLALGYFYLPLPAAFNTNFVKPIVGLAGAAAIGMIGSKVAGRRAGEQMAAGAAVVVIYGVLKNIINTAAPSLPLSDYNTMGWTNPGMPVGYSMGEYVGSRAIPATSGGVVQPMPQNMGEYIGF